jgi:hypothetical protein
MRSKSTGEKDLVQVSVMDSNCALRCKEQLLEKPLEMEDGSCPTAFTVGLEQTR